MDTKVSLFLVSAIAIAVDGDGSVTTKQLVRLKALALIVENGFEMLYCH